MMPQASAPRAASPTDIIDTSYKPEKDVQVYSPIQLNLIMEGP